MYIEREEEDKIKRNYTTISNHLNKIINTLEHLSI